VFLKLFISWEPGAQRKDFTQFVRFCSVELQRYRSDMRQTELTVERRMESELTRQKSDFWKCISGCPARCTINA
jgi:hypothetical protein